MSQQYLLDLVPEPAPTLENFVVGTNAEVLHELHHLQAGRALYLWGPASSGRSHLLRASAADGVYIDPARDSELLQAAAEGTIAPAHTIAVDDAHLLAPSQQASLFALYNRWRASSAAQGFRLVVSGDRSPLAMPSREDLRTRLGWDLVFRLDPLSDTDKHAALTAQAADRGLNLSDDVIRWMLTRYERDMRRLSALVDALDKYSLLRQRPVTIPLLKAMLAEPDIDNNP